jgi:plastocyanin
MKTKILLISVFLTAITSILFAATITVTNNGTKFVPDAINIQPGDTVVFSIASSHNAVEVGKNTWDANGNTSNGGFSLNYGGGQLILNTPGTYYYVCSPHAYLGMKGTITAIGTSLSDDNNNEELEAVYPNPFSDKVTLNFTLSTPSRITIDLLEITGIPVGSIVDKVYDAGKQVEVINVAYLKPGQYLLRYQSNRKDYLRQIIKVK